MSVTTRFLPGGCTIVRAVRASRLLRQHGFKKTGGCLGLVFDVLGFRGVEPRVQRFGSIVCCWVYWLSVQGLSW